MPYFKINQNILDVMMLMVLYTYYIIIKLTMTIWDKLSFHEIMDNLLYYGLYP